MTLCCTNKILKIGRPIELSINVRVYLSDYFSTTREIGQCYVHCQTIFNFIVMWWLIIKWMWINLWSPKDPANTVLEFHLGKANDLYGSSGNRQYFANIRQDVSLGGFSTESLIVLFHNSYHMLLIPYPLRLLVK